MLAFPASVVFILKVIYGNCKIQLQSKIRARISLRIQSTASGRFEKGKPLKEKLVLNEARSLRTVLWAVTAKCLGALVDDMSSSYTGVTAKQRVCTQTLEQDRRWLWRSKPGKESTSPSKKSPLKMIRKLLSRGLEFPLHKLKLEIISNASIAWWI